MHLKSSSALRTLGTSELALDAIEREIESFCSQIYRQVAEARRSIANSAAATQLGDHPLAWLPYRPVQHEPLSWSFGDLQLRTRFDLTAPLPGQRLTESIGVASIQPSFYVDAVFTVETIALVEGSLSANLKGFIAVTATTLGLMLAAFATPPGQDWYDDRCYDQRIERTIQGQQYTVDSVWRVDLTSLRELMLQDLNYDESSISTELRALRVANVQLALKLAQGSPSIDGKAGPETRAALSLYATSKNLPPETPISDVRLRGLLLEELQHTHR